MRLLKLLQDLLDCGAAHSTSHGVDRLQLKHEMDDAQDPTDPTEQRSGYPLSTLKFPEVPIARTSSNGYNTIVEVLVPPFASYFNGPILHKHEEEPLSKGMTHTICTITNWTQDNRQYFTLTFSSIAAAQPLISLDSTTGVIERTGSESSTSAVTLPADASHKAPKKTGIALRQAQCSSLGPCSGVRTGLRTPTCIQEKASRLKDAILDSINMPAYGQSQLLLLGMNLLASDMWSSYVGRREIWTGQKALLELMPSNGRYDTGNQRSFLEQYTCWTEDFQRQVSVDEFPTAQICRS
jgi:hypothetical protein